MAGPAAGAVAAAAGKAIRLLDRNASCVLRMTKATHWQINRRLCTKPPEGGTPKPSNGSSGSSGVPGYKPTDWDKKLLLWTGRFKKAEDVPELLPFEVVSGARSKVRVQLSYLMMALTILGCVAMAILGKQGTARFESLTNQNLEKKAQLRAEDESTLAKP